MFGYPCHGAVNSLRKAILNNALYRPRTLSSCSRSADLEEAGFCLHLFLWNSPARRNHLYYAVSNLNSEMFIPSVDSLNDGHEVGRI